MNQSILRILTAMVLGGLWIKGFHQVQAQTLRELPTHSYDLTLDEAYDLIESKVPILKHPIGQRLVQQVKGHVSSDLNQTSDNDTRKEYFGYLSMIALIKKDYGGYSLYLKQQNDLEQKPSIQLTRGISYRALIHSILDKGVSVGKAFKSLLGKINYKDVYEPIWVEIGRSIEMTTPVYQGRIDALYGQRLREGSIDLKGVMQVLEYAYATRHYLPYQDEIREILLSYKKQFHPEFLEKRPNVFLGNEVILDPEEKANPVIVAIWDTGFDTEIFKSRKQLWENPKEVFNNEDDDGNGFVDDVHAIAYDLHNNKTTEFINPIELNHFENIGDVSRYFKGNYAAYFGLEDLDIQFFREETQKLKAKDVTPLYQDVAALGYHAHGTHVASITAKGNPFIRLLSSRISFYRFRPEKPTEESYQKRAKSFQETVDYFREQNVRIVNMSWYESFAKTQQELQLHGVDDVEETGRLFDILKTGLHQALASAPEIWFFTSAGNFNKDVAYDEVIPNSFGDLKNLTVIGATDQSGNPSYFTSYGKNVYLYANGLNILSDAPGGGSMYMSGTSMSAPLGVNLATKMLAKYPEIAPVQGDQYMKKGATKRNVSNGVIGLLNPKQTMKILQSEFGF